MSPTTQWGAREPPPPLEFPGFLNRLGIEGPRPNPDIERAYHLWWLALDISLANTIRAILGLPVTNDTISYYAAVAAHAGEPWGVALCAFLEAIDAGHCAKARRRDGTA